MKGKICGAGVIVIILFVLSVITASSVMAQTLKYIPSPREISEGFFYTDIEPNSQQVLDDLQKECGVKPIYGESVNFHDRVFPITKPEEIKEAAKSRVLADGIIMIAEFSNIKNAKKCYSQISSELPKSRGYILEVDSFGDESYSIYNHDQKASSCTTVFRNGRFIVAIITDIGAYDFTIHELPKIIDEKLEQKIATTPTSIPAFQIIMAIATLLAVAYLLRRRK
jgi:hypothetical protein